MALNAKQQRFVDEYLIDLNATQAAIRAGYSQKTAHSIGHENLNKPDIAAAVAAGQGRVAAKLEITAEKITADLEALSIKAADAGQFGAAIRAKELLGKHVGMFEDKLNVRFRNDPNSFADDELAAIVAGRGGGRTAETTSDKAGLH